MAYSNFTLEMVRTAFQLEIAESAGIFSQIESVDPSAHLATTLARNVPLAITINKDYIFRYYISKINNAFQG